MDNCSKNGSRLRGSVLEMAEEWKKRGFVEEDFIAYVSDETKVSFPWTMIDKITPRPSEKIAEELEEAGGKHAAGHHIEKDLYCSVH